MASIPNKKQNIVLTLVVLIVVLSIVFIWLKSNESSEIPNEIGLSKECEEQAKEYVGKTEQEASVLAQSSNKTYRIISRDDESFPVTEDFLPERLNFAINKNIVSELTCG